MKQLPLLTLLALGMHVDYYEVRRTNEMVVTKQMVGCNVVYMTNYFEKTIWTKVTNEPPLIRQ